jgi:preprotein translocase subunit SecG
MTTLFIILIIVASVILGLVVLVQNPKGGGLAGNVAGFSNQFMGVKQTTDVLEKGTWIFAAVIGVLCITSSFFISGSQKAPNEMENVGNGPIPGKTNPNTTTNFPAQQQAPAVGNDTSKH